MPQALFYLIMPINSKQLYERMTDHVNRGLYGNLRQDYREYLVSHCSNPQKTYVYNTLKGCKEQKLVSCGRCYHCRQTKVNEWVTRMYYELEDYKYCYFVTLSYRSISDLNNEPSKLLLETLEDALWHHDDLNTYKHMSWNPCVLCKDHYQKFLKRLRKYSGANIRYVLSGEYGKKYGRPHYHLILFSDQEISEHLIRRCWSLALVYDGEHWKRKTSDKGKQVYYFPFGNVDIHDLVKNGSLDQKHTIKVDGKNLNAGKSFAYVCKYIVGKDNCNYDRVRLVHTDLFSRLDPEWIWNNREAYHFRLYGWKYHTTLHNLAIFGGDYCPLELDPVSTYINPKTFITYDESVHFVPQFRFPSNWEKFLSIHRAFTACSTREAIGSLYANAHCQEFLDGSIHRPLLQSSSFVFPDYFNQFASKRVYSLRWLRNSSKAISSSKGCLSALLADMQRILSDCYTEYLRFSPSIPKQNYPSRLELVKQNEIVLYDSCNKLYYVPYAPTVRERLVKVFKSNRSGFRSLYVLDAKDFVSLYYSSLQDIIQLTEEKQRKGKQTEQYLDKALQLLQEDEVFEYSFNAQLPSILQESTDWRKRIESERLALFGSVE